MRNSLLLSILIYSLSLNSFAGVYSFGGGCASQGAWTQAALAQTETIIQAISALRDNPDCKGIESLVPKLDIAQQSLKMSEDEIKRSDRIETIPNELSALRNFSVASPDLKKEVLKLLTLKTFEGASLTAAASTAGGAATFAAPISGIAGAAASAEPNMAMAAAIYNLSNRVRRASAVGMDALGQVLTILPSFDRCLVGKPDQGLALVGAAVKLTAAFSSSQDGVISRLGNSISSLVSFLRNSKFSKTLKKMDESELWLSMSCLLETTSQTYCSARDARKLLDYAIREMKPKHNVTDGTTKLTNPLEGYYVLTRDIPRVSGWLQKIMFGITPKLTSEASFKNKVIGEVAQVQIDINSIQGLYQEQLLTYSTLNTRSSKQNFVLDLSLELASRLNRGQDEGSSATRMNFFTMTVPANLMPFKLILGMDNIPPECIPGAIEGRQTMSARDYIYAGGKFHGLFMDPDDRLKKIGQNLDVILSEALVKASLYFQQRMIVDVPNLVNESVTSQTDTVVQSLQRIQAYLNALQNKIINGNQGDLILVISIRDSLRRVRNVLSAYEEVRNQVIEEIKNPGKLAETPEAVNNLYRKVIEAAYENFNVLLQRDTFLATRLSTYIQHDYAMRIKNNDDISPYEQDLLLETGKDLLYRILNVTNQNPTMVANDLATAQVVNKRNLEGLEQFLRDSMYPMIYELGQIAKGKPPTDGSLNYNSYLRMYQDSYYKYVSSKNTAWENTLGFAWAFQRIIWTGGMEPWVRRWSHPELYPFHLSTQPTFRGKDDEFGSFEQFKSRLCVQTLAFEDRKFFEKVCKGSVLKSAFSQEEAEGTPLSNIKLNLTYNDYMTPERKAQPVNADSICAFQTYSRRNLVYWMTLDMYRDNTKGNDQ